MKLLALKKIIPTLLIIAVLFTGFFGVVGTNIAHAQAESTDFSPGSDPAGSYLSSDFVGPRTQEQQEEYQEYQEALENERIGCKLFRPDKCIASVLAVIGNTMLKIFAFFTGVAGYILDKAVNYTVVDMGDNTRSIGAIETGWKTFRDLSNIVIIFVLLVIGIATILRLENYGAKALLAKLIVVALLINFSLFFTQVVIDSSNLISLQFYNKITTTKSVVDGKEIIRGVGERYMDAFGLTTVYDGEKILNPEKLTGANTFGEIFLVAILGSVVFLVASFAFLAGAFLLISRFVVLIFLMILAPLAFVGMILPSLSKHAGRWWGALMRYAFFAPAYMILTWFVIEVINSEAFKISIGLNNSSSFAAAVTGENMAIIFNFIIVIAFIIASVLISNYFGIIGSNAVMKWGHAARKFGQGIVGFGTGVAGRGTIGLGSKYGGKAYDKGAAKFAGSRVGATLRKIPGLKAVGAMGDLAVRDVISAGEKAKFGSGMSQAELDKKLEERRKGIAGVQRKVAQQEAIKELRAGGLTPERERELTTRVGRMSIKEFENLSVRDKERLANPNIAQNLSTDTFNNLEKSEVFTKQQIEAMKDARFKGIIDALNHKGTTQKDIDIREAGKKQLQALSDKEMEIFGDRLYQPGMVQNISQSQVEGIKKSAKINSGLTKHVLDTKEAHFKDLIKRDDGSLEKEISGMKIPQIAKLDPGVLTSKEGINFVSRNVLAEIIKESTDKNKKEVIDGVTKAYDEATKPGSSTKISKDLEDAYEALTDKTLPMALFT